MSLEVHTPSIRERVDAVERHAGHDPATRETLDALAALAADQLSARVVLVSLVDDTRQFFKGLCGLPDPWATRRQTGLSHSFCRVVVETREPLVVTDARQDPRIADNLAVDDLRVIAYAGHPLVDADGHVLGSFCVIDVVPRTWTPQELELVGRFAGLAEKVLFAASAHGRGELGEVEALSRRLQRALLPVRLTPGIEAAVDIAYQPGMQRMLLGGDFVDVLEHADGAVGFVLGDVCGHGPESAALAIELRATWAAIEAEGVGLATLAHRLNVAAWRRSRDDGLFATAVFGRLDPARRAGEVVCAGHEPPVALDPEPYAIAVHHDLGMGVVQHSTWTPSPMRLGPRGLLAYTDGLIEGMAGPGAPHERFGPNRLLRSIGAHLARGGPERLVDRLVRDATAAHGDELFDDVAVAHIRGTV